MTDQQLLRAYAEGRDTDSLGAFFGRYEDSLLRFAGRLLSDGDADPRQRIARAWQTAVSRPAQDREIELLITLLETNRRTYEQDPLAALALMEVGMYPTHADDDPVEIAAWTAVARAIFNLNEFITRN